jgi:hypothetical protein
MTREAGCQVRHHNHGIVDMLQGIQTCLSTIVCKQNHGYLLLPCVPPGQRPAPTVDRRWAGTDWRWLTLALLIQVLVAGTSWPDTCSCCRGRSYHAQSVTL